MILGIDKKYTINQLKVTCEGNICICTNKVLQYLQ